MSDNLTLSDIAAVTGNEGWGGGSIWVIIFLIFAMMGGFGGFGNGAVTAATTADIQRAVDLNSIQQGQANIGADIQRTTYETIGAVKDSAYNNLGEIRDVQSAVALGNSNIINNLTALQAQMQNCCCETKSMVMENRYLDSQNTASIMANDTANTQKILDAIATNRMADMQNQINQLQLQNAVSGVVRYPMASTYSAGMNPYCGCGTSF